MALGNKNNSGTLVTLKPVFKSKDGSYVSPFFRVKRKIDGEWVEDDEGVSSVTGNITRLNIKDAEYNGQEYKDIALFLRDPAENESYIINFRMNIATRTLFNALVNLDNPENVSISLYTDKKSGYARYALRQNDDLVRWKFELDDLPDVEEATLKGKTIRDYTDVDNFFVKELEEWAGSVLTDSKQEEKAPVKETVPSDDEDDDIPF